MKKHSTIILFIIILLGGAGLFYFLSLKGDGKNENIKLAQAECRAYEKLRNQSFEAKKGGDQEFLDKSYNRFGKDLPLQPYQWMFLHHIAGGNTTSRLIDDQQKLESFGLSLDDKAQSLYQVDRFELLPFDKAFTIFTRSDLEPYRNQIFQTVKNLCE